MVPIVIFSSSFVQLDSAFHKPRSWTFYHPPIRNLGTLKPGITITMIIDVHTLVICYRRFTLIATIFYMMWTLFSSGPSQFSTTFCWPPWLLEWMQIQPCKL